MQCLAGCMSCHLIFKNVRSSYVSDAMQCAPVPEPTRCNEHLSRWAHLGQCNAMQYNAMQCKARQCSAMQQNAAQCNAMQCSAMQGGPVNAMQCSAMPCSEHLSRCLAAEGCEPQVSRQAPGTSPAAQMSLVFVQAHCTSPAPRLKAWQYILTMHHHVL